MCERYRDESGLEFDADCRNTFWVEAPLCLLTGIRIRQPGEQMTLEERMNNITRIVIIVFVVMLLAKMKNAQMFLIIALLIIIIFYYAKKRRIEAARAALQKCKSQNSKNQQRSNRREKTRRRNDSDDENDGEDFSGRFRVRAGNGRQDALNEVRQYPERFAVSAGNDSHDLQIEDDEAPEQINEANDYDENEVEARHQVLKDGKRNPRRPYPPTVSADVVVRAGNRPARQKKPIGRVFNADPNLTKYVPEFGNRYVDPQNPSNPINEVSRRNGEEPRYRQEGIGEVLPVQPRSRPELNRRPASRLPPHQLEEQEPEEAIVKKPSFQRKNDDEFDGERGMYLRRSFQGGPKLKTRRQGYQTRDFQDEEQYAQAERALEIQEDDGSDLEAEDNEEVEEVPLQAPAQEVTSTGRPKKTFLPSNYEAVMPPAIAPAPHKMNAYGAGRRIRKVAKWSDNNSSENRIDAADIMYNQAAKLEKTVKARHRIDRESHVNSILSV